MAALSLSIDAIRPLNRWDDSSIRPGAVGSIGDVNCQPRLKHSAPELPLRFEPEFAHGNEVKLGSNVSDGQHLGYDSKGGPARLIDSNWGGRRHFKTRHGYIMQDLRQPDTRYEPYVGATPQYSWRNKLATTYDARRTGEMFLPLPGGYAPNPGETPRGGLMPRITDVIGELDIPGASLADPLRSQDPRHRDQYPRHLQGIQFRSPYQYRRHVRR